MLRVSLKGPMQLKLGADCLSTPRASMRSEMIDIPYNQIQKLVVHSIQRQQLLVLSSAVGQSQAEFLRLRRRRHFRAFLQKPDASHWSRTHDSPGHLKGLNLSG